MKKKILALAMASLMSLSLFACGGGTEKVEEVKDKVEETVEEGVDKVEDAATDVKEGAENVVEDVKDKVEDVVDTAEGATVDLSGKRFAIVVKSTGNPYNEREAAGFEEAVKEMGGDAIIKAPDAPTVEAQMAMVEELITQKVDGIAIAGNDFDALQNVLKKAMDAGIFVVSLDSAVNENSRMLHVNQADSKKIGETLVEAAFDMSGGGGEFAILSATSQAANQNIWIEYMEEALKDPKYSELKLVKIAYGDDLRDKSTSETEGLLKSYPDLKCIVAPTTVGIAAAAKVVQDKGLSDTIKVTGLGLPSEMAEYIESGTCPYMYLWNPIDVGYLAGYSLAALVQNSITGAESESFSAGRLGEYTITADPAGGTEVLLGAPFKFEPSNIGEWKTVY